MNKKLTGIATCVIVVTITLATLLAVSSNASAPNQKVFVGTWERFSSKNAAGEAVEERLVRSFLLFSADGHFSQTTNPAGREKLDKPLQEMTKEELLNRFVGVGASYGTYAIAGNKLTRKFLSTTSPSADGTEFVQMFRIEGDILILTSTTAGSKGEARFRRVK